MPPSLAPAASFVGLVGLCLVLLPLGLLLVELGERLVGRRVALTTPERLLTALFASGSFLYVFASIPAGLYLPWVVGALLTVASVVFLTSRWRRGNLRSIFGGSRWLRDGRGWILLAGTVALLAFELTFAGTPPMPNAFDGATQALFAHLLLQRHSTAVTLSPYAMAGITYPQGAAVWLSVPSLIWGWPVLLAPAIVPLLFLALSFPAVYCWGERLGGVGSPAGRRTGLLLAVFFGVVASWPRLFVGGSYDFSIALPLLFLAVGWLVPLTQRGPWTARETLALGLVAGTITALSVPAGETFLAFAMVALTAFPRPRWKWMRGVVPRFLALTGISLSFVTQSIASSLVWYGYPGHVLSAVGEPPLHPPSPLVPTSITWGMVNGMLNPFVPWKPKLSPFPYLSVELAVLLGIGIGVAAVWYLRPRGWDLQRHLPARFLPYSVAFTATNFALTGLLVAIESPNALLIEIEAHTSVTEESILLFIGFQLLAAAPLIALLSVLLERWTLRSRGARGGSAGSDPTPPLRWYRPPTTARFRSVLGIGLAVALLMIPFASGALATGLQGPAFLERQSTQMGDATPADFAALEWAGASLPSCSRVLVAPGSAAQFLPEYATVSVLFPMVPTPVNGSYNTSVVDLSSGIYGPSTRAALESLAVTEVFVTGPTSISYAPFQPGPLLHSADFTTMFAQGDAYVFGFVPGIQSSGCAP